MKQHKSKSRMKHKSGALKSRRYKRSDGWWVFPTEEEWLTNLFA